MECYRTHYSTEVTTAQHGCEITVAGWVQDIREMGSIAFLILRDRMGTLQVTMLKKKLDPELFKKLCGLNRESVIAVRGTCKPSDKARNGYEVIPEEVEILSEAGTPLPMGVVDKVGVDLDTRLDNRFIDLRKEEVQAIFKIRNRVIEAAHGYLRGNGFIEMHSPNIIGASSEGGTDLFAVQYFEKQAFLSQSPQLYKQTMMATGFDRVYEIAKYFRAEQHNTRRHLNESTAIDLEMAFVRSEEDVMGTLERLIRHIWDHVADNCTDELSLLGVSITVPSLPMRRVTYDEAVERLAKSGVDIKWGDDIGTEAEKLLGDLMQKEGCEFYFITKYPLEAKPFYAMPENGMADDRYARAFDLELNGVEITSGAQRIHDVKLLEERITAKGLKPSDFEGYLKAFRYGMPPHGGFGLGIERIVMNMLGIQNIRECTLFPRDRMRISP
ncbi:MAG: aspartate--tRNA(Asn) ligase [Thermoplasmata archaeon HGW-Thermoplasmata-1]|nr:MAG: aspartate--tRNA(Asn) ligase [Thermoplasmata archaeon HGW-Thermoplasmata-1]